MTMPHILSRRQLAQRFGTATLLSALPTLIENGSSAVAQFADMPVATTAVRSPLSPDRSEAAEALPPLEIVSLNRMGFGPRPGDIEAFRALARTPDEQHLAYVDQQLDPATIDDSGCDALLAAQGFVTMEFSQEEYWHAYVRKIGEENAENDRYLPIKEVRAATFLRAAYSKRQLKEVLVNFWHNHFNVYGWSYWQGPTFGHYDRDVIRKHALGNFREMIEAVAKSPAMLYYLDNQSNKGGDPNENYARELFELHTMGAENYLGIHNPSDPALFDENGDAVGYIDEWVYGATTCFTGWRVDYNSGLYHFDDSRHFPYQKSVLGKVLPSFRGERDGMVVLDMLARHPGTARHVCRKLCRRFIEDDPSDAIVQMAADIFLANVDDPDQLQKVVRSILLSTEFKSTWGKKIKRPFEHAVSIVRATQLDLAPVTNDFFWRFDVTGQGLFSRETPDGYPDRKGDWLGTMSMMQRMRVCNFLVRWNFPRESELSGIRRFRPREQMPTTITTPQGIVDFWIDRVLGRALSFHEYAPIVNFMASKARWNQELRTDIIDARLPHMISLIMLTPTFMLR